MCQLYGILIIDPAARGKVESCPAALAATVAVALECLPPDGVATLGLMVEMTAAYGETGIRRRVVTFFQ